MGRCALRRRAGGAIALRPSCTGVRGGLRSGRNGSFPEQGGDRLSQSSRERDTICPSWCQLPAVHVAASPGTGETTHTRLVREIFLGEIGGIRAAASQPVRVEVEAFADLYGREHLPTVRLALSCAAGPDPDADDLTPAEARELAGALLEAARMAES